MLVICTDEPSAPTLISYLGVTLTFSSEIVNGTFDTDGSPWFIGPVAFPTISHAGVTGRHGAMINPSQRATQGYDSRANGYDVAANVMVTPPATINPGETLCKAISLDPGSALGTGGSATTVDIMAVFTCLSEPPAAGAFRPPYSGTDKTMRNRSEVNHALSPGLTNPTGPVTSLPTLDMSTIVKYVLYDVGLRSGMRSKIRPETNFGGNVYPGTAFAFLGCAALYSLLDMPDANEVRYRLVQHGIDYWANMDFANDMYSNGAGFGGNGALFCILYAGTFLEDADMLDAGLLTATNTDNGTAIPAFGEQYQFYYNTGAWNGYILPKPFADYTSGLALFGDSQDGPTGTRAENWSERNLATQQLCIDTLGQTGMRDAHSYTSDSDYYPNEALFNGTTIYTDNPAGTYMGIAIQAHMGAMLVAKRLGMDAHYNCPAFFDFLERVVNDAHNMCGGGGTSSPNVYVFGGNNSTNLRNLNMNMWLNYYGTRATLTSQSAVATGSTTADVTVTTNLGEGKIHVVATTSSTKPNGHQIRLGVNTSYVAAPHVSSAAYLTTTGAKTLSITGLAPATVYHMHITQYAEDSGIASVVTCASITTDAAAASPAHMFLLTEA